MFHLLHCRLRQSIASECSFFSRAFVFVDEHIQSGCARAFALTDHQCEELALQAWIMASLVVLETCVSWRRQHGRLVLQVLANDYNLFVLETCDLLCSGDGYNLVIGMSGNQNTNN